MKDYPHENELGASQIEASSSGAGQPAEVPHLATELLDRLTAAGVSQLPALKSRVSLVAQLCGKSAVNLTIDEIHAIKPRLRQALSNRKYSENSIQAYTFDVRRLLRFAEEMGWRPCADVPEPWTAVFLSSKESNCLNICRDFIKLRTRPHQCIKADVDAWIVERTKVRSWDHARKEAGRFIRVLAAAGAWPKLSPLQKEDYGIRFSELPERIKCEINTLLRWKTAPVAKGRQKREKIRECTAKNMRDVFSGLYGFSVRIKGFTPETLMDLVSEDVVYDYVTWSLEDRGVCGRTVHIRLVPILAVLRQHPDYEHHDVSWLKVLVDDIDFDSDEEQQEKRAAKQIPYADIIAVPRAIRRTRDKARQKGPKKLAWVVQLELILLWLTVLPWRQRNLRECRVGGSRPNLFKGSLRNTPGVTKPSWVQEELRSNPEAEFWQVKFAPEETKTGHSVHAVLPRPLVELLEEFLSEHRVHLLGENTTETLLLSNAGTPLFRDRLTKMVGEQTLRFTGKRVTPHTYRHIVAYTWLERSAKDYLTLSKILWHRNVNTTIRIYGSTFNESNGACAMESFVESLADG